MSDTFQLLDPDNKLMMNVSGCQCPHDAMVHLADKIYPDVRVSLMMLYSAGYGCKLIKKRKRK